MHFPFSEPSTNISFAQSQDYSSEIKFLNK